MLLVSTREWVLKTDSKERLNGILSLLQRAKYHMPSRALGVQLWLKENGQVTALTYPMSESDVTRAHYKAAADQMLRTVQEYYEEDEVRRLFGEAIESHARAGDLLSLYLIERSGYYFMGKPATYAHIWMVLKTATLLKLTHGDVLGNWHPASSDWFEKLLGDEPWAEYVPIDSFSIRHLSELTIRFKGRECKRRGLCE